MNVQMGDGLPGSGTVIDADVEAIRGELSINHGLSPIQQGQQISALIGRQIKERPGVPPWDDQSMALGNRKTVADDKTVLAAVDHP